MRYIIKDALNTGGNPRTFSWSDTYSDLIEFYASSDEEALQKAEALQDEHDSAAEAICRDTGEDINVVWENAPSYVSHLYAEDGDDLRQVQV